jgi:rhamnosyl/mannosyltransferase
MERVLQALCEGERERGVDSRALVVNTAAATVTEEVRSVPVTRAGAVLRVGSVWLAPSLVGLLRRDASDVLVLHEPNPMALLAYAIVRPKRRLVIWYHSEVVRPRWRYRLIYHPFLAVALRRASRILVSSPALIDEAQALGACRHLCAVVPFGLPIDESPASGVERAPDRPVVLFVGRLVAYKGVEYLIRALKGLDVSCVIIGDGPLRGALEREAAALGLADRVTFAGSVPDDTVAAWYAACDLLVLPSVTRAEAFGLVQLEAMARGKPVISTKLPTGVPWVNQDGVTGLVVPPGDVGALHEALRRVTADESLRLTLGCAARARFLEHFTQHRMAERTAGIYEAVASEPLPSPAPVLKRAFDVALSGVGLVLSAPIWLAAAALIKLEDGGPIFFRQERVGRGGGTFTALKFRSMVPDAERDRGPLQASARDPRVTRMGRIMRATAMDELPQLLNIFRGDMSFVGPRALRPGEIDTGSGGREVALADIEGYQERSAVQPGLTGIAQIYAPRDVARRQKFRYDRVYVKRRSFWLDLRLIAVSFWISLRGTWEHRERKF